MGDKTSVQTIVNVTGGAVAVLLIAYTIGSYTFLREEVTGCMADYSSVSSFALRTSGGQLMSAIEIQAQAGANERGLMENSRVIDVTDNGVGSALAINLGHADVHDLNSTTGIDVAWRPLGLTGASASCLRYSVFMGKDFDFGRGGNLPGFFGGDAPSATGEKVTAGFVAGPRWTREGYAEVLIDAPVIRAPNGQTLGYRDLTFDRGRWVTVEQELSLNDPGAANGRVRVWIDGVMKVDAEDVKLRDEDAVSISGVLARAGYAARGYTTPTGESATLLVSPMEIGWR